jgi:hypothetical protein
MNLRVGKYPSHRFIAMKLSADNINERFTAAEMTYFNFITSDYESDELSY